MHWLAAAGVGLAGIAFFTTLRPDLAGSFREPRFLVEFTAIAMTATLAALAAFASTVPGSSASVLVLPVPTALIWLATLGEGCRQAWIADGGFGPHLTVDWECLPIMLLVTAPPALLIQAILLQEVFVAPARSPLLDGLAVTALGSFGSKLPQMHATSVVVLTWLLSNLATRAGLVQVLARAARSPGLITLT